MDIFYDSETTDYLRRLRLQSSDYLRRLQFRSIKHGFLIVLIKEIDIGFHRNIRG